MYCVYFFAAYSLLSSRVIVKNANFSFFYYCNLFSFLASFFGLIFVLLLLLFSCCCYGSLLLFLLLKRYYFLFNSYTFVRFVVFFCTFSGLVFLFFFIFCYIYFLFSLNKLDFVVVTIFLLCFSLVVVVVVAVVFAGDTRFLYELFFCLFLK